MKERPEVWKALAEPTRRRLLDLLRDAPRTTGQLAAEFPELSRFAVMKHLTVLENAGLVVVERRWRERWNYLNAVPLQQELQRWMTPYAGQLASAMLALKAAAEEGEDMNATATALATSGTIDVVNEVTIDAPREKVFDALLQVADWWPHRFRDGSGCFFEPRPGGRWGEDWGNGDGALYGTVTRLDRPAAFTITGPMGMAGPVVGVWSVELDEAGPNSTVVRGSHRAFGDISPETTAMYEHGWVGVYDALRGHLGLAG
jgi:uncharacterized protein YndB with AHSA1/START domain/DNA-binding transcriptional ArsR family regulator